MGNIRQRIAELNQELIDLRRDFHMYPELGFQEQRTAAVVETYLSNLGIRAERVSETGVVGLLKGAKPGPVLMLRADMDALPLAEENDLPYRSKSSGISHACGHDAHMAMLLVAARILSEHRELLAGTIKFVFQPDEEVAGAIRMIEDGILENPHVDAAVGMHIWTPLESGKISITPGAVMSSLDVFKITIHGKGGHTGSPESAVDPILAAANLIQTVQLIQTREISHLKSTIIMFGKISGGTKNNIIPEKVELEGSIRFLYEGGPESAERPLERFCRVVRGVCETHQCTCDIDIHTENIPLINDDRMVRLAKSTAKKVFHDEAIVESHYLASEDFSFYSARVPAVFMFLGTGNASKRTNLPHHNSCFNIDEDTLRFGVEMYIRIAMDYFTSVDQRST
jgi:amidohydrolase